MTWSRHSPAFLFNVLEYLGSSDVQCLSLAAEAVWLRLRARLWVALGNGEAGLPSDAKALHQLTRNVSAAQWRTIWQELEPMFPVLADNPACRTHPETLALWVHREGQLHKQRANGKLGGRPKRAARTTVNEDAATTAEPTGFVHDTTNKTGGFGDRKPTGFVHDDGRETHGFDVEKPNGLFWANPKKPIEVKEKLSTTPTPPPGGGGASPSTPTHGERSRTCRTHDVLASDAELDAAVEDVPDDAARAAMRRYLVEQHVLVERWSSTIARFCGWRAGIATTARESVSWLAIAEGLGEILDTNPPGQRITPGQALTFVERAQRRATGSAAPTATIEHDEGEFMRNLAIGMARKGDVQWQEHCQKFEINYSEEVAA